jgi:tRNA (mo5U34)-methyltransferase
VRARGPEYLAAAAGPDKGSGFRIAHEALGSSVERIELSVYDHSPERLGTFDVVVCGSLMLHLRDPLRAMAAVRSVTSGVFLSSEAIDLPMSVMHRRKPLLTINGVGGLVHWTTANAAGHRQMMRASGFRIERHSKPYTIPYGVSHPARGPGLGALSKELLERAVTNGPGVPHHAALGAAI